MVELEELRGTFGFGVAGNFAGHLEQAGEAGDFSSVQAPQDAPKGIFPWYVPGGPETIIPSFLHTFPLSSDRITIPARGGDLQIEPEVGLLADVLYAPDGSVAQLTPRAIAAFNDCSIRRPGARKISEKKNWGPDSKGVASRFLPVSELDADGSTRSFRLASFLVRGGEAHAYGLDSPLPGYSYYGAQLLHWIIDRLAHQAGAEDTPLEPVGRYLQAAGRPPRVLIGIGATRYTPYGESTYLRPGDEAVVVLYDGGVHSPEQVAEAVKTSAELQGASVLRQQVISVPAQAPAAG